jgi:TonB family protein
MLKFFSDYYFIRKYIFLFILFPLSVAAQKNGMAIEKDSSGMVRAKGKMKDGKKNGEWKTFDDNGNIKSTTQYSAGKKEGIYLQYFYTDTIVFGYYKNGLPFGEWKKWSANFTLKSIEHFDEKGNKTGICEYWDDYGNLTEYSIYRNDGTAVRYLYFNGKIMSVRREKNNMLQGTQVDYNLAPVSPADSIRETKEYTQNMQNGIDLFYSDGKVIRESHYCNDRLCDTMKSYMNYGVTQFTLFVNGKKEGIERTYSNGKLAEQTSYHNGFRNGKHFTQDENGMMTEEWYKNETLDSSYTHFASGNRDVELKMFKINRDSANYLYRVTRYSHAGILLEEFHVVLQQQSNYYYEGEYKTFYANGKVKKMFTYHRNTIEGKFQEWTPKEILVLQSYLIKNVLQDSTMVWNDLGKPLVPGTIEFDQDVVKNMEAGMIFPGTVHNTDQTKSMFEYYKSDSTTAFEDCKVYSFAQQMPEFQGGSSMMMQYLNRNIKYPQMEKEAGKSGTVYISFVITREGKVVDVKCVKEVPGAPGLSREAMRVFKSMPIWAPGMQNGKAVNVYFIQPVKFTLQ